MKESSATSNITKTGTYRITLSALFAALACIGTLIIQIPTPTNGYVNVGDCFVILAGLCLGPVYGGLAAGIGSMLSDVISGYMIYAPATVIIKLIMAVLAYYIFNFLASKLKTGKIAASIVSAFVAEIVMVAGYFAYEAIVVGYGLGAAVGIPSNLVQGLFALILAPVVYNLIFKNPRISIYQK